VPRELILNFHGLGEPPSSIADAERKVWIPLEWFEEIVDAAPRDEVSLTFDDGNSSDVELALPALAERGLTARFFPLTGRIGAAGYLSADDITMLRDAGMEIGSHGCDHRDWRMLEDRELHEELTVSRRTLAEILDSDITEAACPFGSYDRRVLRALHATGYRRVFTSDGASHAMSSRLASRTTIDQRRPLVHWLELAAAGASRNPSPVLRGKRLVKRLR
jgi:peptidoglycan/xylan/chitin deacetylase (PgdA/CDA1 family)